MPVHLAARQGSPDLLNLLIKYNAFSVKRNKFHENALHIAAANNKFEFIKVFLAYEATYVEKFLQEERGGDTSSISTTLTKSARSASLNTIDTVDSIVTTSSYKPCVKVFNRGQHYTPLFAAVANGHLNSVVYFAYFFNVDKKS